MEGGVDQLGWIGNANKQQGKRSRTCRKESAARFLSCGRVCTSLVQLSGQRLWHTNTTSKPTAHFPHSAKKVLVPWAVTPEERMQQGASVTTRVSNNATAFSPTSENTGNNSFSILSGECGKLGPPQKSNGLLCSFVRRQRRL